MVTTLILSLALAQGIPVKSGADSNLATVTNNKALTVQYAASTRATYACVATGLVTTALYSMQLNSEVSRGFRIAKICVGGSNATAAALQTITVQRRTTAASGGTAASAEGTASPAVSQFVPGTGNWGGVCSQTPTLGTAGAVLDGWSQMVGELGAGTADVPSSPVFCRTYGDNGEQMPSAASGVANGISVSVTAAGAGGLASGSISVVFIGEGT